MAVTKPEQGEQERMSEDQLASGPFNFSDPADPDRV
jgi:hypothetical protein